MNASSHLREPLRRTLTGQPATWPRLDREDVDALVAHGVAPLVYANARVPELRDAALHAAALEPLRLADLREVLAALAAGGIRALLLKGSALAYEIYEQPELRPRGDTDLLIDTHAFEAAREVFRALDFEEQVTSGDEHANRQRSFTRVDRFGVEHAYDVHWAVANSPLVSDVLRLEEIEPVPLPRISPHAFGLPRVEALLLACVHRVAHHHDDERLIWLVDIARLRDAMSEDEQRRFWMLAGERRVVVICERSLDVASSWLGGPRWAAADRRTDEPSAVFLDANVSYGRLTLANLRALPWRARLTRLWQLAFPPPEFMQASFATRSRAALPWLYVRRGARGLTRLFRKAAR